MPANTDFAYRPDRDEPFRREGPDTSRTATLVTGEKAHAAEEKPERAPGSAVDQVVGYIEAHPVLSAAAALAVGATVAMVVRSRSQPSARFDRQLGQSARALQRSFEREMRAMGRTDVADRLGRMGSSVGDAFSKVDLSPLVEQGRAYLEAMRRRVQT